MSVDCSMLQCRLVLNLMLPSSESRILCFKLAILLQWQSISFMVVRRKKFYLFLIIILQPYEQIWQGLQCYVSHWGKILILSKNSFFLCLGICCFLRHFEKWLFFLSFFKKACGLKSSFANVDKSWHSISAAKLGRRTTASSIPFQTKTDL